MNKFILILLFVHSVFSGMSANDSIQTSKKKFSLGLEFAPITYSKWSFPNNQYGRSTQSSNTGPQRDATSRFDAFNVLGLNISFNLREKINIGIGVYHTEEKIRAYELYDNLNDSTVLFTDIGRYICKYITIPLSVDLNLSDNGNKRSFTNITLAANLDFIYFDTDNTGFQQVRINGQGQPGSSKLGRKEHSVKNSFNRIVPTIYVGRERFNKKGNFSFKYGSMFTFPAIYQNNTALIYYKNYKISVLVIGCSYHF